jgi:hypothetical protein
MQREQGAADSPTFGLRSLLLVVAAVAFGLSVFRFTSIPNAALCNALALNVAAVITYRALPKLSRVLVSIAVLVCLSSIAYQNAAGRLHRGQNLDWMFPLTLMCIFVYCVGMSVEFIASTYRKQSNTNKQ